MSSRFARLSLLAALFSLSCGAPEKTPSPPPAPAASAAPRAASSEPQPVQPEPEKLAADTPRTTAGGASFVAPAGWSILVDGARVLLTGPEPDLRVAIVESDAASADQAVAAAWPALIPGFRRPLRVATSQPGRRGWQERRNYDYETSPNEKLAVFAWAMRAGSGWVVLAVDAALPSLEKRLASLRLLADSLRPRGYTRESFAGKTAHKLDQSRVKQIGEFVEQGRVALSLPGVAVSLLQGDQAVMQQGFGVRELGKPAKVDADTLFMIASNTKALATLLLATQVDQGKFTWETPVTQVYPGFKLGSADTTSRVLMKHLVCACTGLPRQDLEWLFEYRKATPASAMQLLGTMQPTTRFGETFQYSNLMAAAAGFIGGYVDNPRKELGAAFDEAMKRRIFDPLGMSRTTFDYARALAGNHASPHGEGHDGTMVPAPMDLNYSVIPVRPAGAAWSSARDLLKYVRMELAKGKRPDGAPLLSESCLLARREPQVSLGEDRAYGMGLMVGKENDVTVVHHGGDMIGFHSDMFWLPEHGVGGVILTNGEGGHLLRRPLVRKVLEVLFDGQPEASEDVASAAQRRAAQLAKARERQVVPPEADAAAKLASRYSNPALGDLAVLAQGAARVFDVGEWKSAVGSRKNDDGTVSMVTVDPGIGGGDGLEFVLGDKAGKRTLTLRDMQHEYEFVEVP
jgi:CubicO group peptidase (beta-lactamase class C family)